MSEIWLQTYYGLHGKYQLFLSDFNKIWIFSTVFRKILNIKFHENPSSGRPDVPCDRRTDGWTDRHEEAIAFINFANAPKKGAITKPFQYNCIEAESTVHQFWKNGIKITLYLDPPTLVDWCTVPSRCQKQKPKDKASYQSRLNPCQHRRENFKSSLLILTIFFVINSGHSVKYNYYLQILFASISRNKWLHVITKKDFFCGKMQKNQVFHF
jgi:hypothetical protein